jgi:para-aminobenzoate synthetase component 1
MIVDLLRNDLGRVCAIGSVKVEKLFELQSFNNVHHLVSTVSGQLDEKQDALGLLEACFPGGSITGTPKLRAMQIIEELENHDRAAYCGSLFYLDGQGNMDSNITIRSLLCRDGEIHCWAGGGIVSDSVLADEYTECFDKIDILINTLQN